MTMESRTGLIDASALTMDALDRAQMALGQMRLYLLLLRAAQDDERLADGQFREVHIFIREQMMALVQPQRKPQNHARRAVVAARAGRYPWLWQRRFHHWPAGEFAKILIRRLTGRARRAIVAPLHHSEAGFKSLINQRCPARPQYARFFMAGRSGRPSGLPSSFGDGLLIRCCPVTKSKVAGRVHSNQRRSA